jgi:hypothetical protein
MDAGRHSCSTTRMRVCSRLAGPARRGIACADPLARGDTSSATYPRRDAAVHASTTAAAALGRALPPISARCHGWLAARLGDAARARHAWLRVVARNRRASRARPRRAARAPASASRAPHAGSRATRARASCSAASSESSGVVEPKYAAASVSTPSGTGSRRAARTRRRACRRGPASGSGRGSPGRTRPSRRTAPAEIPASSATSFSTARDGRLADVGPATGEAPAVAVRARGRAAAARARGPTPRTSTLGVR